MRKNRFKPNLEILENRDTPSGATLLPGGTLVVTGTPQADFIRVFHPQGDQNVVQVDETTDGKTWHATFEQTQVKHLVMFGGKGDDTIDNFTSISSVIFGGPGNDTIQGGSGHDVIFGGPGNDTIHGGGGGDVIYGGGGNDTIVDGSGHNVIHGGTGNDTLTGGPETTIFGGTGHNTVIGGDKDNGKTQDHEKWSLEHIEQLINRLEKEYPGF